MEGDVKVAGDSVEGKKEVELSQLGGGAIIRAAMAETGTTQVKLSKLLGYKGQGTVSSSINTMRMSLGKFVKMLSVMGYEVVVRGPAIDAEGEIVGCEDKWEVKPPEDREE